MEEYILLFTFNCLHSTEKNKFEENRVAALAEDVNNGDVKTEFETEIKTEIS